jgi:hypothetical protein
VWLAADEPEEGERVAVESIERWSHKRSSPSALQRDPDPHTDCALSRPRRWGVAAARNLNSILRQTYLRRVQFTRFESCYLRARSALAMAAENRARADSDRVARAEARRIARERMPWSDPIAYWCGPALRSSRAILHWP